MRGLCNKTEYVPVAQLDRVTDSDSVGRRFESFQARHTKGSMQRMEFFVCIPKGKQELPVRRSSRFQYENGLRSSSSADFSGTAGSGRKIKKRRVSFQARQQKSPSPCGFGDLLFWKFGWIFELVLEMNCYSSDFWVCGEFETLCAMIVGWLKIDYSL